MSYSTYTLVNGFGVDYELTTNNAEPEPLLTQWLQQSDNEWQLHHVDEELLQYHISFTPYINLVDTEWQSNDPLLPFPPPPEYGPGEGGKWVVLPDTERIARPIHNIVHNSLSCINRGDNLFYRLPSDGEGYIFLTPQNEDQDEPVTTSPGDRVGGEISVCGIRSNFDDGQNLEYNYRTVYDKSEFLSIPSITKPVVNGPNYHTDDTDWWRDDGAMGEDSNYPEGTYDPGYPIDACTNVHILNEEPVFIDYGFKVQYTFPYLGTNHIYSNGLTLIEDKNGTPIILSPMFSLTARMPVIHPRIGWTEWVRRTVRDTYYTQGYYPYVQRDFETPGIGY